MGVSTEGHRAILGLDVVAAEDGAGRLAFLRSLIARGLSDVRLAVSEPTSASSTPSPPRSLLAALPDAPHALYGRGGTPIAPTLSQVPKSAQPWVATLLRTVFEQTDTPAVQAQMRHVLDALEAKFPKATAHLHTAQHDLLAFTGSPREL